CIVHRKGATRAFGPGNEDLPERYRATGQPVVIPGSMGTASYVLAGTEAAMRESFGSACHGAGRQLSRRKAKEPVQYHRLHHALQEAGIEGRAGSANTRTSSKSSTWWPRPASPQRWRGCAPSPSLKADHLSTRGTSSYLALTITRPNAALILGTQGGRTASGGT